MNFDRFEYLNVKGVNPKRILDIGAHIGTVSQQMKQLWPNSDILMLEANPYLRETLEKTGIPYKICLLGKEPVISKYYMTDKWTGSSGNSIYRELTEDYNDTHLKFLELQVYRLDDFLPNEQFDLIKIDTQGSEIDILTGGIEILKKSQYVIIECSVMEYNKGGCRIGDVFEFMNKYKFQMYDIVDLNYKDDDLCQVDLTFKKYE